MGSPLGNKAAKEYSLPKWLFALPKWQKRLFLASLFGADLSKPKTVTGHGYNFYAPIFGQNKKAGLTDSGVRLLENIAGLLQHFGVKTTVLSARENAYTGH